ncbi:MAG: glycoside hydrolase family 3 N-terminal domain-containing protein, partial [Flavobacteriaceae bacterium]
INTNAHNPIIGNRSFGSSKERVIRQARAIMKGHHDAGILTSGKHFPGHGDTDQDSHKTLPTVDFSIERLNEIELAPYRTLIQEGLESVMVAHLNVPSITQKNLPTSLSRKVIQELLVKKLGFKGLIVTDALNMKGVSQYSGVDNIDLAAFLAGNDLLIISNDIPAGIQSIKEAFQKGMISEERLAHSVKKMLKAKYKVGLSEYQPISTENIFEELNTVFDEVLYNESISKALTLLKNDNNLLPLKKLPKMAHIPLGDDVSKSFEEQLSKYHSIPSLRGIIAKDVLQKTKKYDTLLISFHRSNANPWKASDFNSEQIKIIEKLAATKTVILDIFVKPYGLRKLEGIQGIDAILVSYQNSEVAQKRSVDALFGAQQVMGRLPVYVSSSFKEADGIDLSGGYRLGHSLPAEMGFDFNKLQAVDRLAQTAIDSMMTPGMQILVSRKGKIVYQKNFGYHTYKKKKAVRSNDLYDLASLTKILGTLPLVMQAYDRNKMSLDTTVSDLIPEWKESNKAGLTLREMLSHFSRLWPWIPFYKATLNSKGLPKNNLYREKRSDKFSLAVAKDLFLKSDFEEELYEQIKDSKLIDSLEYRYSDLPYYMIKKYFERTTQMDYDQLVFEKVHKPLGLKFMGYNPLKRIHSKFIIPSEIDSYFRHRTLHGYVHDMGAAMQNGVGGHAGLFGNSEEVAAIMQMYLQGGNYHGIQLIQPETISKFNTCSFCGQGNRRGIGFDKPQLEGLHQSTCGCVSDLSFGHSGYTGTFAWADPEKQIIVVILSNRTYPDNNFTFSKKNIRTRIQGLVYDALIN